MECWGDNTFAQMAKTPWDGTSGTKSKKSPDIVYNLGSSTTFSKVSTGAESFFTADLIDNGSIAVLGTYNSTEYENHFVLNRGAATDVAAGTNHICYLESGAVTCVGDNSAGQTFEGILLSDLWLPSPRERRIYLHGSQNLHFMKSNWRLTHSENLRPIVDC